MWGRLRRLLPYYRKAVEASARSLPVLLIVVAFGAGAIALIKTFNAERSAEKAFKERRYKVDKELREAVASEVGPYLPGAEPLGWALGWAIDDFLARTEDAERSFAKREEMVNAILPALVLAPSYPTVASVLAQRQREISELETEIARASDEKRQTILGRNRDFLLDKLRFELAKLPDQQRELTARASQRLHAVLPTPKAADEKAPWKAPITRTDHPMHMVYEAAFYLAFLIVALAISYCAAMLLRLVPVPGAADAWKKVEDKVAQPTAPSRAPAIASAVMTTAVVGVGLLTAGHGFGTAPGSPFQGAWLGDLLPVSRQETPSGRGGGAGGGGGRTVTPNVSINPAFSSSFDLGGVYVPVTNQHPVRIEKVEPATIEGLEQLKDGVANIGTQAEETKRIAEQLRQYAERDIEKTEALTELVGDVRDEWKNTGDAVESAGTDIRNSILAADYNAEERDRALLEFQTTSGTRRWWRGMLVLDRYQVGEMTLATLKTETCDDETQHGKLVEALGRMGGETALPPLYATPFETTILQRMIGSAAMKDPEMREPAEAEVRRHLRVLLHGSRIKG